MQQFLLGSGAVRCYDARKQMSLKSIVRPFQQKNISVKKTVATTAVFCSVGIFVFVLMVYFGDREPEVSENKLSGIETISSVLKTYRNEEYGFELSHPETFEAQEILPVPDDPYLFSVRFEDAENRFLAGVVVEIKESGSGSLQSESEYNKWRIVGHVADEILSETEIVKDVYKGMRLDYEVHAGDEVIPWTTVLIGVGEHFYTIKGNAAFLDELLASLKFGI